MGCSGDGPSHNNAINMLNKKSFAIDDAGDHSTTTWTKFYPILITYLPRADNCGHFTYYIPFVHMTKRGLTTDHLPTSYCPRSYWMTHGDHGAIKLLLDAKVSATVNGMLQEPGQSEPRGGGRSLHPDFGRYFYPFQEEVADCVKHITTKENIYKLTKFLAWFIFL